MFDDVRQRLLRSRCRCLRPLKGWTEFLSAFLGIRLCAKQSEDRRKIGLQLLGANNTAVGTNSLLNNTSGNSNIALGNLAGSNLTTGNNNIDIDNKGVAGESNTIRIGTKQTHRAATYVAGISGTTVAGGIAVLVDTNDHLGTTTSSARYKEKIQPMDKASEAKGIPQFGLVAEEVAKVNPDLVAHDEEGKPYGVRYEAVNAMLLNEFLKEQRKVEKQEATVEQQQKDFQSAITQQQKQIAALTSQMQQLSEQLRANKRNSQLVADTQ